MIHDIGIIGGGVAGIFAAHRIATQHKNTKTILIELGRPQGKRRNQINGFLGCLPNSDGKLYLNDVEKVTDIVGTRSAKSGLKSTLNLISNITDYKTIKDKSPSINLLKKIKKFEYDFKLNNYIQLFPKEIHLLSKFMMDEMEDNKNVQFSFDNEVLDISKQKNIFVIATEQQEFKCKKLLIAVGRSGWRWAKDLYSKFGIVESNNIARYGVRVEMPSAYLKDFNKSNCSIFKTNKLDVGPFSWFGTVIPEDQGDIAISAFRSNEARWKTDKVSFSFIGNIDIENGFEQTHRLAGLAFLLANDRIGKEKVSSIINGRSKISAIHEYDWLKKDLKEFSNIIPEILTKAYFHVPTIVPLVPSINIGNNLSTEMNNMFVAGESAGITGILSAACSGIIAADSMCKD